MPNSNFNVFRSDRSPRYKKRGGGSAIIVSSGLLVNRISVPKLLGVDVVCLDVYGTELIRIINCYVPPKISDESLEKFFSILTDLLSVPFKKILTGDFNFPNIKWDLKQLGEKALHTEKQFFDFVSSFDLTQFISEPTRENNILDLIFSDDSSLISDVIVLPPFGNSDHNQISFTIKNSISENIKTHQKRCFEKANFLDINRELSSLNWIQIFSELKEINVNSLYEKFCDIIHQLIDKYVPLVDVKSGKLPSHIEKIADYRLKLWKNIKFPSVKEKFKQATDTLEREVGKFFRNKEKRLLSKKSTKQIYSYVSKQLKSKKSNIPSLKDGDKILFSDKEKADFFAKYFKSVFQKYPENDDLPQSETKLSFVDVDPMDVYKRLLHVESKNNTTPDGIPYIFIKNTAEALTFPVSHIFRYSMMSGTVPDLWKLSYVLPLHKKGERDSVKNYRPISLLSSLGKVFESIICEKLVAFFEENNILPPEQHGFRKGKSVNTQLLETLDDISEGLEYKKFVDIIYFDLAKAFDSINHSKLLKKLRKAGIGGALLKWIENWLRNRKFMVKIENSLSEQCSIDSSVPQGSILGPILFNFYISDAVEFCKTDNVLAKFFADDLKAYTIFSDPNESSKLQEFIHKFDVWCKLNDLKIAWEKCNVVYMGGKNQKNPYTIGDNIISETKDCIRDLGVMISPNLKWQNHVDHIYKVALGKLFALFKAIRSFDPNFLAHMYISYVRPILETASNVYNPYQIGDIKKIERVQQTAARLIHYRCFRDKEFSYGDFLKKLKIKTLQERRLISDLVMFHKIMHNKVRINWKNKQNFGVLRNRIQIKTELCKTNARFHSFFVRVPRIYTKLPIPAVSNPKVSSFKTFIHKYDLSQFLPVSFV